MDLDGDGYIDILSGSYSGDDEPLAGLFQVFHGRADGSFSTPTALEGDDGKPLGVTPDPGCGDPDNDRQCTRAFAADLDGDGDLELIVGSFRGRFACFQGLGPGRFAARSQWLHHDGEPLRVERHSDPCLVDWDGDGDLDLCSGSQIGGAFLFPNTGTKTEPRWGERVTLLAARGKVEPDGGIVFGDDHIKTPQAATRIWVADVDRDGKLDLLLGDMLDCSSPAAGLDADTARQRFARWQAKMVKLATASDPDSEAMELLEAERDQIIHTELTGYVWLVRQK